MGNAQQREHSRSGDSGSSSPLGRASVDSALAYEQRRRRHSSQDESPLVLPGRRSSTASPAGHHPPLSLQRSAPVGVPRSDPPPEADAEDPDAPRRLPIVIQWKKGGQDVQLCGSFTQWKKMPMARSETKLDSEHMSIVNVPEGRHEYKFWVDGDWHVDTSEPTTDAPGGGKHNYIVVKNSDFKACDALNMESLSPANEASGSPPGPYGQICPETSPKPWAANQSMSPPPLPPHLLEVILNKDMSSTMEPTLLPAPNHVMLNHLYALSIKDGVMVLSATYRYRKKYVTTLLYKPIK